jgi:hypothetical protein
VRLQVLGHLKISSDLVGNRSLGISACSIAPQASAYHVPHHFIVRFPYKDKHISLSVSIYMRVFVPP